MRYTDVKDQVCPGDLIAFSGDTIVSRLIKWKTRSNISHVGCILRKEEGGEPILVESTTLKKDKGVTICSFTERAKVYEGKMYWYPLKNRAVQDLDMNRYQDFLLSQRDKPYDYLGALFSSLIWYNREDFAKMFCSELVCGAWRAGGIIKCKNCSEQTPDDLTEFPILREYEEVIYE